MPPTWSIAKRLSPHSLALLLFRRRLGFANPIQLLLNRLKLRLLFSPLRLAPRLLLLGLSHRLPLCRRSSFLLALKSARAKRTAS